MQECECLTLPMLCSLMEFARKKCSVLDLGAAAVFVMRCSVLESAGEDHTIWTRASICVPRDVSTRYVR